MSAIDPRASASGFSLVELIVLIMVLGVGLSGTLLAINQAARQSGDPFVRKQAMTIGESIMEEIMARPFLDCGTTPAIDISSGDSTKWRNQAHEVDDYNNFTMTGIRPPNDNATIIPGLAGYTVRVSIASTAFGPGGSEVPNTKSKMITISVAGPMSTSIELVGFRIESVPETAC